MWMRLFAVFVPAYSKNVRANMHCSVCLFVRVSLLCRGGKSMTEEDKQEENSSKSEFSSNLRNCSYVIGPHMKRNVKNGTTS